VVIIEMNPRVSRSSALASKATGFPIAKVAAKLAVGYTLDELLNEITGGATPASFEPAIDYVVTKIPRFAFEKFPAADATLTTQMKSVGEAMSIGRTFQESVQKALRSLETGRNGFNEILEGDEPETRDANLRRELREASAERILYVADAFREGLEFDSIQELTGIDPWFLDQLQQIVESEEQLKQSPLESIGKDAMFRLKRQGFSDARMAELLQQSEGSVRRHRHSLGIRPVYKRVDTCAAEFATSTAYMYSTYEEECEADPGDREKIMVLGGGPNRIGQGIEFDYCCVHAALALRDDGYETIMVNCNPETVSTDYDTSDRLYFEPLTLEDVLEIVHREKPSGVIVQFGGQTPLKLARDLEAEGVPIIGTTPDSIDLAEDRERFQQLLDRLDLRQPPNRTAMSPEEAVGLAEEIGYPIVVRPSYVLGGRAMDIVHGEEELQRYMRDAVQVSNDSPVLLDRFLDHAREVDVDAICDGEDVLIGGLMEHIEQAGVHSGDSACSLPPYSLGRDIQDEMRRQIRLMALELGVVGLMNTQFAIRGNDVYVLEVNPRASRTVPFVSKATGLPLAGIAAKVMAGKSLKEQGQTREIIPNFYSIKEAVFPFMKFPGVDPILGPEMRSTGEVMGIGWSFGGARAKSMKAASYGLPAVGKAFLSVRDADKQVLVPIARELIGRGYQLVATKGTAQFLRDNAVDCESVNKVMEGRPHIVDLIKNDEIDFIVNTTEGAQAISDSFSIRREALQRKLSYTTTIAGGRATLRALDHENDYTVHSLQQLHRGLET
jgi:carbamoyl-phosphate synthase large subunit